MMPKSLHSTNAMMIREHLTPSLLAELYELEEDGYRLASREANRLGGRGPAAALRAVAGHAGETLEELPALARTRNVRLGAAGAVALDTLRRLRDTVIAPFTDHEHAYRRVLSALRRGIDLVRLLHAAARDEGDELLAAWCKRWLSGRETLVAGVAKELDWFARHPAVSRHHATLLPSAL
jgi:hypothetical protein